MSDLLKINNNLIGEDHPVYFIADIAANHDGNLDRAKELIKLSAESGANAAKFQHFQSKTIVSDYGFNSLVGGGKQSHQSTWKKSVAEVYDDASVSLEWTSELKKTCETYGLDFFSTPYNLEAIDHLDSFVPAYKIGSGDITYKELVEKIASKNKPYFIASGAANINEVERIMNWCLKINTSVCLMQCNTNYTASLENFKFINLNVIKLFKKKFPNIILGLSDHTPEHSTVLGAVALGVKVIEKHFTDDNERDGPDHPFSMNPISWKNMVTKTKELEFALGKKEKKVEENEIETVILQRRALRATIDLRKNTILKKDNFYPLRPCPLDAFPIFDHSIIEGKTLNRDIKKGDYLKIKDIN